MGQETAETTTISAEEDKSNQAAFEQLLPRYRAIPDSELCSLHTNLMLAGFAAMGVSDNIEKAGWRPLFAKLPAERFSMESLDLLEPAARGAIYAYTRVASALALDSEKKLPVSVANEALLLRDRMLKVADYHLGNDETNSPLIADIRSGHGYGDLAGDLVRLADLYDANAAVLSKDGTFYSAEDAGKARARSMEIQHAIGQGMGPKEKAQADLQMRAWTFLQSTYEKIAGPGRWLFGDQGAKVFVSLVTAGRKPATRKAKSQSASDSKA